MRPLISNNLTHDSLPKTDSCYTFLSSLFTCATSCFYLLDLWHSDNEQAHSVIGTAAVCPVEMHTSRLETVSLCLIMLHHLCLTLLWLSVLLLAHNTCRRICIHTHTHTHSLIACKFNKGNLMVVLEQGFKQIFDSAT